MEIEQSVFLGCHNLTNVLLPDYIDEIPIHMFHGCRSLKKIEIPDHVVCIGRDAFRACPNLTDIKLPSNVKSIKSRAFADCSSLERIEIPNSVTDIESDVFRNCSSLERIEIPSSVTNIARSAFRNCNNFKKFIVDNNNQKYSSHDGNLYDKNKEILIWYPVGKTGEIKLPGSIVEIGKYAFWECKNLEEIELPNCVTRIGNGAFSDCSNLKRIELPDSIISIEDNTFLGCTSLIRIEIPDRVVTIGSGAFGKCKSLTRIEIPETVTHMESDMFMSCRKRKLILVVVKGSYAETYAKENGLNYIYKGEDICSNHAWEDQIDCQATTKKKGSITRICTKCGEQTVKIIYAAKNIALSKTSYTYNGEIQKPAVTVKDSKGKALKNKKDYIIAYTQGMKKVGSYTITIKLKGNYKGNIKRTFKIIPKGTQISKITPKKKGFTLKWNKQAVQTTGYEIVYSTNKKFTPKTTGTATIGKNRTVSKSVSKLNAGKKYFVKIRTFKTIKLNRKSKKLYSHWSKVKAVTTKG